MRKNWNIWLSLGLVFVVAALCLSAYNLAEDRRAGEAASFAVEQLEAESAPVDESALSQSLLSGQRVSPETPMPTEIVDDNLYIGTLRIPALGLELPVMSEWSYAGLRIAPCRYSGSVYSEDMVIAAHNYASHFGGIHKLAYGAEVSFTDVRGNVYLYEVASIEELGETAEDEMVESGWELTLFTCTFDGSKRVTVRCEEASYQL